MTAEYEASLAETTRVLIDAAIVVVGGLNSVEGMENETLWEIQTEVVWTLVGAMLRGIYSHQDGGPAARDTIQDNLLPILVAEMLESGFEWPENSDELKAQQYNSLVDWFDETESANGATMRFMSSETDFFQMMLSGTIPEDSLVGKLCGRVSRATGEEGNSELIQQLFLNTAEAHQNIHLSDMTVALVQAKKASP